MANVLVSLNKKFPVLNLPDYEFRISAKSNGGFLIFDSIRKKNVALTPEEWVRQNFIQYLRDEKKVPQGLIGIEVSIIYNKLPQRCDIVVYDRRGAPLLIAECKSPEIKISQNTFDQIARYNMSLKVKYLAVTNGVTHFYCIINHQNKSYQFIKELPEYELLY